MNFINMTSFNSEVPVQSHSNCDKTGFNKQKQKFLKVGCPSGAGMKKLPANAEDTRDRFNP